MANGNPQWPKKRMTEREMSTHLRDKYPTSVDFLKGMAEDECWWRDAYRKRWEEAANDLAAAVSAGKGE